MEGESWKAKEEACRVCLIDNPAGDVTTRLGGLI